MLPDENRRFASIKDDIVYPACRSASTSWAPRRNTQLGQDQRLLKLGEDGHKAVRGRSRPEERLPPRLLEGTYLDALDEIAMYAYALDPSADEQYLDSQGVRIREIDALFDEIASPTSAARRQGRRVVETVKDSLCFHFAYDNDEDRPKSFAGAAGPAAIRDSGRSPSAAEAQKQPPTLLRLVKSCLSGENPNGVPWGAALQAMARADSPVSDPSDKAIVFGRPLSDRAFVEQLFPKGFEAFVDARFQDAASFVDADMAGGTAYEAFEFFSGDQGVRFGAMVERCGALMTRADGPAFFKRMANLFEALERGSRHPRDVCAARTAFSRYASGSPARGLAFMLACALIGPENPRALAKVVGQPEACKR
ncbi:MAG: hypothetical protein ACLSVD_13295 [Eggerthellaceae bacterium]